jgi:cation transport protein ChaC
MAFITPRAIRIWQHPRSPRPVGSTGLFHAPLYFAVAISPRRPAQWTHHRARSIVSVNTVATNQQMTHFDGQEAIWLFGYGSLIYKADFAYLERRPASIRHWVRRFWQGSHDHRGTPDAPGRVVTLIPQHDAVCAGMAYRITPDTLAHLDLREKNGYLRVVTTLSLDDGCECEGLAYIATAENAAFLGAASERTIAEHIARSTGPSGPNGDYLLQLADALRQMHADDPHVFAIERELLALTHSRRQ